MSDDAEATEKPPKTKKRHRQTELPGMERKRIKAIERQAEVYCDVRDRRMELTKEEVAEKKKLAKLMRDNSLEQYFTDDGHEVVRELGEETLKVKAPKKDLDADDDGEDQE
jgi:hypothetical protein